jgi:hypothetical protein
MPKSQQSIPATSDTGESEEGRQMKQCEQCTFKKIPKNSPFKKLSSRQTLILMLLVMFLGMLERIDGGGWQGPVQLSLLLLQQVGRRCRGALTCE